MPRPHECIGSDLNSYMQAQIGSFNQSLMCLFANASSSVSIQVLLKLYVLSSKEICEVINSFKILCVVWAETSRLFVTFNKDFNFIDNAFFGLFVFHREIEYFAKICEGCTDLDGGNGVWSDEN